MNREVDFERRLADWLEDGPFDAPDRAIQFAVGHARTHPRGRLSHSALWRGVMNRMNLNHVATPARVGGLLAAAIVVVALVAVAVVGSGAIRLGDGANQIPGVGGPERPTPTVAPPPTPVPATGSSTCTHTATGTTASLGEVTDYRASC